MREREDIVKIKRTGGIATQGSVQIGQLSTGETRPAQGPALPKVIIKNRP